MPQELGCRKIVSFEDFRSEVDSSSKRVVQCHGVFDLLHIGHIRHFQLAKSYGDVLAVTITPDCFVNKGPNRPCFSQHLRAEAIAALDCVDYVIINSYPTAVEAIHNVKPHVYVKGSEYQDTRNDVTGKIEEEINAVKSVGGQVAFTDDITFSSSTLINQFFSPFSPEVTNYLSQFKKKFQIESILNYFEQTKNLNVLIVGEAIIDVYNFSEVIGKAGKEPTLVAKHQSEETYLGGALALANHLSDFCKTVTCLTYLGENKQYEALIQNGLKNNVKVLPIYKKGAPTIVKRRYVETYLRQKLFEVYEINDDFFEKDQQKEFLDQLCCLQQQNDLVITSDFGHGLIDDNIVEQLITSKFLAVNAQSNAGNHGFNCISKYPRADYVCIASRELQLNYRQRHLSVTEQLERLVKDADYQKIMITNGRQGAYACRKDEATIAGAPAFANQVIDRVGAGDAVLAITSLLAYLDAPSDLLAFIGNVVGAEAVAIMGNKQSIQKVPLSKHIMHLLK